MSPDELRKSDTRGWLQKAASDLRAGEHDLTAEPPLLADVVYHAQQCAEKSLKAFLVWHDIPFRKTHSLEELGEQCQLIEPVLEALIDEAAPLTEYAWRYRYPGDPAEPTLSEARSAIKTAIHVYSRIHELLADDNHDS